MWMVHTFNFVSISDVFLKYSSPNWTVCCAAFQVSHSPFYAATHAPIVILLKYFCLGFSTTTIANSASSRFDVRERRYTRNNSKLKKTSLNMQMDIGHKPKWKHWQWKSSKRANERAKEMEQIWMWMNGRKTINNLLRFNYSEKMAEKIWITSCSDVPHKLMS